MDENCIINIYMTNNNLAAKKKQLKLLKAFKTPKINQ